MTKQEFLAMSLPYDVECVTNIGIRAFTLLSLDVSTGKSKLQSSIIGGFFCPVISEIKPVCHPLSDLTKEIEHKGEKFVPIINIAKTMYPNHEWSLSKNGTYAITRENTFEYDYGYDCFLMNNSAQMPQITYLLKLLEWHFDLFDGIKNNEAINVNDLETNPYK